jgi:hypothetical protein
MNLNQQPFPQKATKGTKKGKVFDYFAEARNMVGIGSGAQREIDDWALSATKNAKSFN